MTPSHRNVIVLSLCTPSNTHHDVSGGCVVGFLPVPAFPRAAFVLVICLMRTSHQRHGNIWREDNTLKASCSSLIAHRSVPTISHLSPYHLSFIAKAWRPLDGWEKCPKSGPTWAMLAMSVNLQLPQEAALFKKPCSFSADFILRLYWPDRSSVLQQLQPVKQTRLRLLPSRREE